MPVSVLVNGSPAASVSVLDRGFAFGDGVFRTVRVARGRPLNWKHHYRRLVADCATLRLAAPDESTLRRELEEVAPAEAAAKIIVTRGPATRGYRIPAAAKPTRVVAAFAFEPYAAAFAEDGVVVRRCELVSADQPRLAGAKTLNRLENVLARSEWQDAAVAEGLIADARGCVVGGTVTNVFVVKDDRIATPDLSRCGVVGAQRERVRERLEAAGSACSVRDIAFEELEVADEVFLTNSLAGIWPVRELGRGHWTPGPWTRGVQAMIAEDDARNG